MGSQFCKNIQPNKNQITTIKKQPNCLNNLCNQNLTNEQPYHQHLQPIQFSQMNSIQNTPQKTKDVGQAGTQNKLNQQYLNIQPFSQLNEETATKQNFNKIYVKSKQNIEENQPKSASIQFIQVNRNKQGRIDKIEGNDNYLRIQVPYSVIKLTIKPKIYKQFKNLGEDFQKQHAKIISETYMNWKLHKNGCYVNKITDGTVVIVTSNCYFRGNIKLDSFIAQGSGVLVTEFFNYKGDFKQGKAEGKGTYKQVNQTISCSGLWKNGQMYKGKLTHPHYLYDGEFKNNVPNGKGILQILDKKVKYDGKFIDGLFNDQQGRYECPQYFYIGGFEKGKKHGKGILTRHLNINHRTSVNIQKLKKGQHVNFKNDKLQKQ